MAFCTKCGQQCPDGNQMCMQCSGGGQHMGDQFNQPGVQNQHPQAKSKIAAGLLGIFLGAFGVHNFYLGYTGRAITQLLLTVVSILFIWLIIPIFIIIAVEIWGFVEGVIILCSNNKTCAKGIPLV